MGLDITTYKNLKVVENPQLDEDGEIINWETEWKAGASMEWSEKHFKGIGEGIDPNKVYTWENSLGFPAGSYSGYGAWRDTLEEFAKTLFPIKFENDGNGNIGMVIKGNTHPFDELINFADNEGVIGYVVAKKLYKDFVDNEEAKKFSKKLKDDEYWFGKYQDWKQAFEYASQHGAVDFH